MIYTRCNHKFPHLCDGAEHLLHILRSIGLKSPDKILMRVAISMVGRRYWYYGGELHDRGHWRA